MDAEDLIAELGGSALRGRGGAGFPTGRKASFLAPGAERYLVVNADESEPGSCKDRELMLRKPHALLEGILIVMNVLRLTRAYIYIRGEYLTESEVLRGRDRAGARARLRRHARPGDGYDAGDHRAPRRRRLHLRRGDGAALLAQRLPRPAERQAAVPGRVRRVRAADAAQQRRDDRDDPRHPARWAPRTYHALGTEQSGGTHVMSLSGHVLRPGNYEMPMSQTMGDLIEELAGGVPGRPERSRP